MKNIMYCVLHFNESGTTTAVYDYAYYNEVILKNKSYVCTFSDKIKDEYKISKAMISYSKFQNKFPIFILDNINEITDLIDKYSLDYFYILTIGNLVDKSLFQFDNKIIWKSCKSIKHCVFDTRFSDGDIYCAISQTLNNKFNTNVPVLPHIVTPLLDTNNNLRKILDIPEDAIVFGRYGSYSTFNLWDVNMLVNKIALEYPNIYFIFMNTYDEYFAKCKNIISLKTNIDLEFKTLFINTCDAMLHGRLDGETFGLSCGEFAQKNKNIISADIISDEYLTAHFEILQDKIIKYKNINELEDIILNFNKYKKDMTDNGYMKFTPEYVMNIFSTLLE